MNFLKKYILLFVILLATFKLFSQKVEVCLFYNESPDKILVTTQKPGYKLYFSDSSFIELEAMKNLKIIKMGKKIKIEGDKIKYIDKSFEIKTKESETGFFMDYPGSGENARAYTGNIRFFISKDTLRAVNTVSMKEYVAASVEAEGGYNGEISYYKTQAVICRTYALRNRNRHKEEGFQLCDGVHCQVYPGKATDKKIIKACNQTRGKVIVDTAFNLINAVYHSNSGGITANSEDVWSSQLPYLVSVTDTFSLSGNHADWKRSITLTEWQIFLENKGVNTEKMNDSMMIKKLESRIPALRYNSVSIPVREIRNYFNLKSSFFDVHIENNKVILSGRGYGHGVGLSQEGAMRMAVKGYNYEEIIGHYYKGVFVVNMKLLDILKQKEKFVND